MAKVSQITLPSGVTYDLIDHEINPYIYHSENNKQLWLYADEYSYGSFFSVFTGSASADTASAQIYLKSGNDTFQGTSLYTDYGITTSNKLTTKLSGDNIKLDGDTTVSNNLSTTGTINCGDQLYLKDWNGVVNNNLSAIAAYASTGATSANIYYVSNGYHAFYTGNTRYKDDNDNTVDHGHADPTETPFYIFNDYMRANVPIRFNENYGKNAASETFVDTESGWLGYTGNYAASGTSTDSIKEGTADVKKANYYPVALSGFQTKTRMLVPIRVAITNRQVGTCTIGYSIANRHTSSINVSDGSLKVWITWVRCS